MGFLEPVLKLELRARVLPLGLEGPAANRFSKLSALDYN
jgi:hypothetical protein